MAYKSKLYGGQLETAILAVIEKLDGEHLAEATTETSGLMSAEDKKKLASALASIVSLGTKTDDITNTLQEIERVIGYIRSGLQGKVNKTTTINGKAINDGVVLDGGDIKIGAQTLVDILNNATKELNSKVPTTRTVNGKELTKNIEIYLQNLRDLYSGKYLPALLDEKANAADVKKSLAGKADLNSQGALATGEEQRLVVDFVNMDGKRVEINIPGVYYNGSTKKIETYEQKGQGMMSIVQCVLAEVPSVNVVYCDMMTNTLYRWDGSAMVQVGDGGGSVDAYTKEESDAKFAIKSATNNKFQQVEEGLRDLDDEVKGKASSVSKVLANYDEGEVEMDTNLAITALSYSVINHYHDVEEALKEKVPTTRTINDEPLTDDVVIGSSNIPHDNWTVEEELTQLKYYKVSTDDVVQTTGQATEKVMSQKAVSDLIGDVESVLRTINGE